MTRPVIDRALALSRLPLDLEFGAYRRLYFGAEFCSWALPSCTEILKARKLAHDAGLDFTLMTPVLRQETLAELVSLFKLLMADWRAEDELLISDFGALEPARSCLPQARLVLGPALSGQKRGPRIEDLSLSEDATSYFRQGSWYGREAVEILTEYGIKRVELDNLLQGIAPLPSGLVGSLHLPWLMVTSSRNCPYHQDKSGQHCSGGCGEAFRLTTPQTSHELLQAGNSQFIENHKLPRDLAGLGIDRLVEYPQLPR